MRRQLLFITTLVVAAGAYALSPSEQQKDSGEAAAEVESDSGDRASKRSPSPAATFTPTETIDADSAVSFPVDI